jgi:hypothetical protein
MKHLVNANIFDGAIPAAGANQVLLRIPNSASHKVLMSSISVAAKGNK